MSIWSSGWYYADGEFTISSRVAVEGEINLILCDGADAVTYSPLTYCSKVQQSPDDAELVNTTNALYLYWVEAYEYFNHNQGGN